MSRVLLIAAAGLPGVSKQRVIVEAVLSGKSQREVAALYGVSQPRVSQLVAAWRRGGWEELEPRSSRPRSNPNATAAETVERVLALRAALIADGADAGPHTIAALLDRESAPTPSVTTTWRILIVIDPATGEILRELTLDPDRDYQPRGLPPGPKKGTPRQGGMKPGYRYPRP